MFRKNLRTKLRGLTFVVVSLILVNGCVGSTYSALEGENVADENAAFLIVSPGQEYVGFGSAFVTIEIVDGESMYDKGGWLNFYVSEVILKPGSHTIGIKYQYLAWCLAPYYCLVKRDKRFKLKFNASPKTHYRGYTRSDGDNYWAWIEDEATDEVVAGEKQPST